MYQPVYKIFTDLNPIWNIVRHFYGLTLRIYISSIFFASGLAKINYWEGTVANFKEQYKLPFISPEFAAFASAGVELIIPPLLLVGFATRFNAFILLGMTVVIQLFVEQHISHILWIIMTAHLCLYGAGYFSIDRIIKKLIIRSID